jgi:hypothetical protein
MTGKHRTETLADKGASTPAALVADVTDEAFGDAFTRLAETVVVVPPSRANAPAADPWGDGPDRTEIEELDVEKEAVPLEEQEGVDDPVRMYLREIGKVHLLSGSDEKRIARQMEEAKHLAAVDRHWLERHERRPTGQETLLTLIEQYHEAQKCVKFISRDIGIKPSMLRTSSAAPPGVPPSTRRWTSTSPAVSRSTCTLSSWRPNRRSCSSRSSRTSCSRLT